MQTPAFCLHKGLLLLLLGIPARGVTSFIAMSMQHFKAGLRVVAFFEFAKGAVVLLAGFGLFSLLHKNVQQVADELVRHSHLNPANKYPHIFLDLVQHISSTQLWTLATFALCYALVRWIEAYGLWMQRPWAEWLAAVSGGIYVPIEAYELLLNASWIKVFTLTLNIGIVAFMLYVLRRSHLS